MSENMNDVHNDHAAISRLERNVSLLQERIRLLESENAKFADMLKQRGVDVVSGSKAALELPAPISDPADSNIEALSQMSDAERELFDELVPKNKALLVLKSFSRYDTGMWFRKSPVWVCVTDEEIIMMAQGRRPFIQKTPFRFVQESLYNHVTGEVVLAPHGALLLSHIKLSPLDGYQLLAQVYKN